MSNWGPIVEVGKCAVCGAAVGIPQAWTGEPRDLPLYHDVSTHPSYLNVKWAATISGIADPACSKRPIAWRRDRMAREPQR